jgi:hypothetical protein
VTISAVDFWVVDTVGPWHGPDTDVTEALDCERLTALNAARDPAHPDVDVALALMDLVRDDFLLSGTSGTSGSRIPTCV